MNNNVYLVHLNASQTPPQKDGFGLGLAIVHNIVTMLHGTIRLDSDKGNGSRFIVKIPMQKAEDVPKKRYRLVSTKRTETSMLPP